MRFENLLKDLRSTSKPSEKQSVLMDYNSVELRKILEATYDPFILFNIKIKPKEIPAPTNHDLGEVFDQVEAVLRFCKNSKSPKQNREMVISLLEELNEGSQQLLVGILNKNWKSGISAKTVLKAYPGLIRHFDVQLANTYDPNTAGHTKVKRWLKSFKLDGLRCVALRENSDQYYDKGKWTMYSRTGKEYLTVDHIKDQLETFYGERGWTFFDGELYVHGLSFEEIQGPVTAFTRGQVETMEYHVFVAGEAHKFLAGEEPNHVSPVFIPINNEGITHVNPVEVELINSNEIEEKLLEAFELGYEGIMLRDPDQLYDYKRSNALLKLKKKLTEDDEDQGEIISDCVVESIEYNDAFPVIVDGQITTKRLLNRIWVVQEDGTRCKVGSGYTLEFREKYTENPQDLIGKVVEIKHQEWGANGRMRFPRLHRLREDL